MLICLNHKVFEQKNNWFDKVRYQNANIGIWYLLHVKMIAL